MDERKSSSFGSFISMGTAEARPFSSHKPHVVEHGDLSIPSPPGLSQANAFERPFLRAESQDTMDHLRRHSKPNAKRQSIIDPASIRLSFTGSVSEFPHAMPLEEGLQKLYKLYEENIETPPGLPYSVQITDIPFSTIADSLEARFQDHKDALQDCAVNLESLNLAIEQTKQDLINLEYQYSLVIQKANMRAMTPDVIRVRLDWQKQEIERINAEKEKALQESANDKRERDRAQKQLQELHDAIQENEALRKTNVAQAQRENALERQLDDAKTKLEQAQFTLRSVPSPVQKLCTRLLVPESHKENTRATGKRKCRQSLLVTDSPIPSPTFY